MMKFAQRSLVAFVTVEPMAGEEAALQIGANLTDHLCFDIAILFAEKAVEYAAIVGYIYFVVVVVVAAAAMAVATVVAWQVDMTAGATWKPFHQCCHNHRLSAALWEGCLI